MSTSQPTTTMTASLPAATLPAAEAAARAQDADTGRGIALMVLAVGIYSVMDAMVKWLGPSYPVLEIVFFRSLFAFIPIAYILRRSGSLAALRTAHPLGHALRALTGLVSLSLFFYAYTRMPLANVIAISFAAPLLVTALSVPLLGERVAWRRWRTARHAPRRATEARRPPGRTGPVLSKALTQPCAPRRAALRNWRAQRTAGGLKFRVARTGRRERPS